MNSVTGGMVSERMETIDMKTISHVKSMWCRLSSWWNGPQSYVWGIPLGLIGGACLIVGIIYLCWLLFKPVVVLAH
jgi:hypothetical protein